jgi:hypothetical protein
MIQARLEKRNDLHCMVQISVSGRIISFSVPAISNEEKRTENLSK